MKVFGEKIEGEKQLVRGKGPEIDPHSFMNNGRIDEAAFYAAFGASQNGLVKTYRIVNETGGLAGFLRSYDVKGNEMQVYTSFEEIKAANARKKNARLRPITYTFGQWDDAKKQENQQTQPARYTFGAWEPDHIEM